MTMNEINADFHLHSPFAKAVSQDVSIDALAAVAKKKGLGLVGTGDALHPEWLAQIKRMQYNDATGIFTHAETGVQFVLTAEVEDKETIHHLMIIPSLSALEELKSKLQNFSNNFSVEGRPAIGLYGEALANMVLDSGCLFGPAHAFTPWTSVYKEHNSLRDCYKSATDKISFLEIGLSADTYLSDKMAELRAIPFLTGSDAHSASPLRVGREFVRLAVKGVSFPEIELAIKGEAGRAIVLNAGLDPREGKYHCTACTKCYQKYSAEEARSLANRCVKCGGAIKMGVRERIDLISAGATSSSPPARPPYQYVVPLAELISKALHTPQEEAMRTYDKMVADYGSEIRIILDMSPDIIEKDYPQVAEALKKFRAGDVVFIPGGGGRYGQLIIPESGEEMKRIVRERSDEINCVSGISQKPLATFF